MRSTFWISWYVRPEKVRGSSSNGELFSENVLGLREPRTSSGDVGVVEDAVERQNCDLAKQ
jgi:hypothetical protein